MEKKKVEQKYDLLSTVSLFVALVAVGNYWHTAANERITPSSAFDCSEKCEPFEATMVAVVSFLLLWGVGTLLFTFGEERLLLRIPRAIFFMLVGIRLAISIKPPTWYASRQDQECYLHANEVHIGEVHLASIALLACAAIDHTAIIRTKLPLTRDLSFAKQTCVVLGVAASYLGITELNARLL